ncbi:nitric oxide reductase activation protein NorD [Diaphorobacter aerolatus]|uniref:nitric oxide reductase activation protein NorD n=1 Tax=Diaphorobacter aerolatus TaxID=1288495 RepID=UPI001D00D099|nr:VWA domain-containing protein [Diaphorobacter aerolatus]
MLADLSQSTDAYATPDARVIDLIRDSLQVFGEALSASGDAFEMLGFSSVRRHHVRIQFLKGFEERWGPLSQARVQAIKPGFYTRMGAAIRHATQRLAGRPERQRLLLILTDGKPNDLDIYEGRYGLEDTRHAIHEARSTGLTPFCVTIDATAHDYLPYLFGSHSYTLIHRPQELNHRLARLYAELTRP